jgi:acetoin utilization protein AcuB
MKVRDIMVTEPVTVAEDDHLDLADDIMTLGRIRHLPVVRAGVIVGVLSQRDLFRAAASSALQLRRVAQHEWLGRIAVRSVMSAPPVTTTAEADIRDVVDVMLSAKIGCLPVVGTGNRLKGLVSEEDCLRALKRILDNARVRQAMVELAAE